MIAAPVSWKGLWQTTSRMAWRQRCSHRQGCGSAMARWQQQRCSWDQNFLISIALFELGGPVFGFVHHRGITHSLFGGAGLALLGAALLWSVWRSHPYWRDDMAGVSWGAPAHRDGLPHVLRHADLPAILYAGHYTADAVFIVDFTYSALMITALLLVRMVRLSASGAVRESEPHLGGAGRYDLARCTLPGRAAPDVASPGRAPDSM